MDLLFASVNLPECDTKQITKDILRLRGEGWWWDSYRSTSMLPLMTKGGLHGKDGSSNKRASHFEWVPYTPAYIKEWFDGVVFPWMGCNSRVMALLTKPNQRNNEHIDCEQSKMGTQQHKFRVVVHGNTDTLYFKTQTGDLHVPNVSGPFIMDGSWPHGMHNYTNDFKLTLAVGAPWSGNESYNNVNVLLNKSKHVLPHDYAKYFQSHKRESVLG